MNSEIESNVINVLRAELAEEVANGFPRLKRIPYTDIVWFLDHFPGLQSAEQEEVLDGLARWGALAFFPRKDGPQQVKEIARQYPAFARLREAGQRPGAKGGTRYSAVKMLRMDPSLWEIGGYHESWRTNFTPMTFQPRADLVPDLADLKSAKAPLLRKLVRIALKGLGFVPEKGRFGGEPKFVGLVGTSQVTVRVDFGSFNGQLSYGVSVINPAHQLSVSLLSYEQLWDANLGWDYLTEENAPRSIDFFAGQVVYLEKLVERVNRMIR